MRGSNKACLGASPSLAAATMSRQPSPAPPSLHSNQMYHQQPLQSSSKQPRTKPFSQNVPGGADDVKYQAKYKELKKKVKEIELVRRNAPRLSPLVHSHRLMHARDRTTTGCT